VAETGISAHQNAVIHDRSDSEQVVVPWALPHIRLQVVARVAVCVLIAGCANDTAPPRVDPIATTAMAPLDLDAERELLDEFARELVAETQSAGGIVALRHGSGDPTVVVSGATGGEPPTELSETAAWHVASVTKSYTAALAVSFASQGLLDLDVPIERYIAFPRGETLTLRQILTHTSGIAGFGDVSDTSSAAMPYILDFERAYTTEEAIAAIAELPPLATAGTSTHYSNANYMLAGAILERVGGAPLGDLFAEHLFSPAGLRRTWYPTSGPAGPPAAVGLDDLGDGAVLASDALPLTSLLTLLGPSTAAVSDVTDLFRWADIVLRTRQLGDIDLSAMSVIQPGGYGLGVAGVTAREGTCVFDGCPANASFERLNLAGDIPGASTRVWYDPATDVTLLVYLNRNSLELDALMAAFLKRLSAAS